jgi:hypothetical protein
MLSLKFSPLLLFIILLVVLVFSTIICKNCLSNITNKNAEGFVNFQLDKDPTASTNRTLVVGLPQYSTSKTVTKLYDSLFFDQINGNMIEVNSSYYSNVDGNIYSNLDSTGASVTNIYINTRSNSNHSYTTTYSDGEVVSKDTTESLVTTMANSSTSWSYVTLSGNTDRYQLFYMPWADSTYIHIIKLRDYGSSSNSPTHLMSYLFGPSNSMANKYHSGSSISLSTQNDDTDTNNGKYVYDSYYDANKTVYQLSKYVKFDKTNGHLIIRSNSGITIYDRYGTTNTYTTTGQVSGTSNQIASVEYNSFIYTDNYKYIVLYMPVSTKTVIALLKVDPTDSTRYKIEKVVRFNSNGVDSSSGNADTGSTDNIYDYYRFWYDYYRYFNGDNNFSEDYMLKTQIVPPVCPSCPSCSGSCGTCTNCGGKGGSGTLTTSGSSVVPDNVSGSLNINSAGVSAVGTTGSKNMVNNTVNQTGTVVSGTVNTAGNLVNKTIDTTGNLLTSAGSGATDLVKSGAGGAVDLVKSGVGGAVDLVKSGVGGTVDLVKSGAGGAVDLLKSAGSGLKEIAKDSNGRPIYNTVGTSGSTGSAVGSSSVATGGVSGVDNYSYYGALSSKGSNNFIPVTADFSAFSK